MNEAKRMKRIYNEWKELENSRTILENSGIYYSYSEENPNKLKALLLGPSDTPYENGYYLFEFEYPNNYPMQPPTANFYTSGSFYSHENNSGYFNKTNGQTIAYVRFNPNLYTTGKVCLSMLNTWSGPGWVPTNTICNVLVAIQALVLNENPLVNEPGFESAEKECLERYNDFLTYANIHFAINEMIKKCNPDFQCFLPTMKKLFIKNIETIRKRINEQIQKHGSEPFLLTAGIWSLTTIVNYTEIKKNIEDLYNNENNSSIKIL